MEDQKDSSIFTLASQGGISLFGKVCGKSLGFIFVIVATRLVSPSEYGLFTLGISIVMFVQGFTSLNINRSLDYFIPKFLNQSEYGHAKSTLITVFSIGIFTSLIGSLILISVKEQVSALFQEPELVGFIPYLAALIPLYTVYKILSSSFNSIKKMECRVLMRDLLNPLVRTIGAAGLVFAGYGVFGLIAGQIFGLLIAILLGSILLFYEAGWILNTDSKNVSNKDLVSYSVPLVFAGVLYSLVGQIDYFVIGYFYSSTEVGQYRVAYLLSGNLLIVLSAITPIFKPMIAENQSDSALLESRYQLATRWVTMLTLPIALTLILAPKTYLSIFFTSEYSIAATALVTLLVGYLINASFGPEGMVLEGLGHTRLTLFNTAVLVCTNTLLNFVLIPTLGILGAGIATGTALAVGGAIGVLEIHFLRSVTPYTNKLFRVWLGIIPSCIIGWAIVFLNLGKFPTALILPPTVVGTFVLGLRLFNGFSEDDFQVASRIDDRLGFSVVQTIISPGDGVAVLNSEE
ncbi:MULTISPECIES: oligosaccharide flippase family protein [Haloferax]|uniref:Oligosaccharide flippase family protein n=1 Tax=Haloferax marinum TaxID=2666143 RepID=A0A6A8G8G4_9EURY|nr:MULTISPECIES: oligosaccharide flippase family protein [Haloferax]KAB1198214.1 oligosaccharide flippase family protein [Haloferax sp. CBA1150]MRW97301.1 oligosaccharide flippase family protein [Haloferax marinum]